MSKRVSAAVCAFWCVSTFVPLGTNQASAVVTSGVSALQLAQSIATLPTLVTSARYDLLASPLAVAMSTDALSGFPRSGAEYGIMSSGWARALDDPNGSGSTGTSFGSGTQRGDSSFDVTVLRIDLEVPAGHDCLAFDFRFLSEEFPEYVGSRYNDAFIAEAVVAELGGSSWRTSGSQIVAPDNFAFDPDGNPITINAAGETSMTSADAVGTTFDGATPLLTASSPIEPGPQVLFLSIFDQGDSAYDSAVMLDALRTSVADASGGCRPGVVLAGNTAPDWEAWHAGDIHVHAAGDTNLDIHPQCTDELELANAACASKLVDNTLQRAKRFDVEWLMFTEHAPWLHFAGATSAPAPSTPKGRSSSRAATSISRPVNTRRSGRPVGEHRSR